MDERQYRTNKARLEELRGQITEKLEVYLPIRLQSPEWYMTGLRVGLESLHNFHEASKTVYTGARNKGAAAASITNLKVVYERLEEFANLENATGRSTLFLENKERLERLLREFEEQKVQDDAKILSGDKLSIIQQVAKDLHKATNTFRGYENLLSELKQLMELSWFRKKQKETKVAGLLAGFRPVLETLGVASAEALGDKNRVKQAITKLDAEVQSERTRLLNIRDAMYKDRERDISDPHHPIADLHPKKIIPFLREISREGLVYLERAHTAYSHALEKSDDGPALQEEFSNLARELDWYEKKQHQLAAQRSQAAR